jgi:hypothetical protein
MLRHLMRHETVTLKATVLKINNLEIEETKKPI